MTWDNEKRSIDSWNKNHKLSSATKILSFGIFQELAKQIGKGMQRWIDKLEYGNRDLAGGLTKFWRSSSVKISPKEQVELMKKLYNGKLPFATENITLIKNANVHFMGKVGSCSDNDQKIGWFVGAIKRQGDIYYFATNIKSIKVASGVKAKDITESILKSLEILE